MRIKRILRAGIKYLKSSDYRFLINAGMGVYNQMPDEEYLKRKYQACMGKELNLENPQTFNEKLQWLKLHDRKPEYTMMVDKYRVREYIAKTIGEEYLIPLLGVWEDPEDIDFDVLPDQFVLKCNHNSGLGMCICKDKSKLDIQKVKRELKKGLQQDYYLTGREWPYKNVPRRIVAEAFMKNGNDVDLIDYKVMCFNGEPKLIQVHLNRSTCHKQDYYDVNWNKLSLLQGLPISTYTMEKPEVFEKMLFFCKELSKGIPHVRVDWYIINKRLYFGELTFSDSAGFSDFRTVGANEEIGEWIDLSQIEE